MVALDQYLNIMNDLTKTLKFVGIDIYAKRTYKTGVCALLIQFIAVGNILAVAYSVYDLWENKIEALECLSTVGITVHVRS